MDRSGLLLYNYFLVVLDISIIIPFKDKAGLTIACIKSLSKYAHNIKEVLLISNSSSKVELQQIKNEITHHSNMRLLEHNVPFNFQEINNWGIQHTTGKVVMLLNNDVELNSSSINLLDTMYSKALEKDIGAVGCVLVYEDNKTIQHAGVYLVPGATADHLYIGVSLRSAKKGIPVDISTGFETTAVTAAAVIIERKKLEKIKYLNEDFIICGGDVDMCLRLKEHGYKTWLTGLDYGYMIHKESKSRSMISVPYIDFVESYKSYIKHFDMDSGDQYLPWGEINNV